MDGCPSILIVHAMLLLTLMYSLNVLMGGHMEVEVTLPPFYEYPCPPSGSFHCLGYSPPCGGFDIHEKLLMS